MDTQTFYLVVSILCTCIGGLVGFILYSFKTDLRELRKEFEECKNSSKKRGFDVAEKLGCLEGKRK
jgi:hypothetical protein